MGNLKALRLLPWRFFLELVHMVSWNVRNEYSGEQPLPRAPENIFGGAPV